MPTNFFDILKYIRDVIYPEIKSKYDAIIATDIGNKVDKITGKGLSEANYTDLEKQKLSGIDNGANNYEHPATHPVSILNGLLNPSKFVKSDAVGNTGWDIITWSDIQGKPNSFLPSTHNHTLSDITDAALKADRSEMITELGNKVNVSELGATVPILVNGKIPAIYFGSMTAVDVFTASSQANMLLLSTAGVGDQCVRSDLNANQVFILKQLPPSDIANWIQLSSIAEVTSVNGMIGAVIIDKSTVGLFNVDNTTDLLKPLSIAAINALALKANLDSPTFTGTVGGITKAMVGLSNVDNTADLSKPLSTAAINALALKVDQTAMTTALGLKVDNAALGVSVATLVGGTVPANQLPSFVDDVLEYANLAAFPVTGEAGKIYTTLDTNKIYRWGGSAYIEISSAGVSDSAVKLQTARLINGVAFDGQANINIEDRLGISIASSATTTIGAIGSGDTVHITGTTTITSFGISSNGTRRTLIFDGVLTLTHNATSLILPGAENITTEIGDSIEVVCANGASGYWKCTRYTPAAVSAAELKYLNGLNVNIQDKFNAIDIVSQVSFSGYNGISMLINNKLFTAHDTSNYYGSGTSPYTVSTMSGLQNMAPVPIPSTSPIVKIAKGGGALEANFALLQDGSLYTWGANSQGACGLGHTNRVNYPTLSATGVVDVYCHESQGTYSVNDTRLFILKSDGFLYGAGYNAAGALGDGTTVNKSAWTKVTTFAANTVSKVFNLGSSFGSTYVLKTDGTIWACGRNDYGQLGNGNLANQATFINVTTAWAGVAAVKDIKVTGGYGYMANTTAYYSQAYTMMLITKLDNSTIVRASGCNGWGNLGNGTTTDASTPVTVLNSATLGIVDIDCGGAAPGVSRMLTSTGDMYSWGDNSWGEVGNGVTTITSTPYLSLTGVAHLVGDGSCYHTYSYMVPTFAIKADGTLWGCGYNSSYHLGIGHNNHVSTYTQVKIPIGEKVTNVGQITTTGTGGAYVAYTDKGNMYVWGYNAQCGITDTYSHTYVVIPTLLTMPKQK